MATNYPGSQQDFSDVSAGQDITASNHNTIQDTIEALQTKLGLTSLASLSATAGHFSLPTSAGAPTGNPANGAGSMVWDNTNNKLYVNEDGSDSSWAEVGGGGGGSSFTTAVDIDVADADNPALKVDQTGGTGTSTLVFEMLDNGTPAFWLTRGGAGGGELVYNCGHSGNSNTLQVINTSGESAHLFSVTTGGATGRDDNVFDVYPTNVAIPNGIELTARGGGYFNRDGQSFGLSGSSTKGVQLAKETVDSVGFSAVFHLGESDDTTGNMHVKDSSNNIIQSWDKTGFVTINSTSATDPALKVDQAGAGGGLVVDATGTMSSSSRGNIFAFKDEGTDAMYMTALKSTGNDDKSELVFDTGDVSTTGREFVIKRTQGGTCAFAYSPFVVKDHDDFPVISSYINSTAVRVGVGKDGTGNRTDLRGRVYVLGGPTTSGIWIGGGDPGVGAGLCGGSVTGGATSSMYLQLDYSNASKGDFGIRTYDGEFIFRALDGSNSVTIGQAGLATGATTGFPYIPHIDGEPSATPTAITDMAPMAFDEANDKLWIYNGSSWVSTTLS